MEASDSRAKELLFSLNLNLFKQFDTGLIIPTVHGDVELAIPEAQTGKNVHVARTAAVRWDQYKYCQCRNGTSQKQALKEFAAGDLKSQSKRKGLLII